jgi:hypothetical protein
MGVFWRFECVVAIYLQNMDCSFSMRQSCNILYLLYFTSTVFQDLPAPNALTEILPLHNQLNSYRPFSPLSERPCTWITWLPLMASSISFLEILHRAVYLQVRCSPKNVSRGQLAPYNSRMRTHIINPVVVAIRQSELSW